MKKILSSLALLSTLLFAEVVTVPTVNNTPITMDINGEHIDFQGYEGKYILLEYFGTRCPVCTMEIDHLKSIQKNNPYVKVIAVELQNTDKETLSDYIFEKSINYPVIDFSNAYDLYRFAKNAASTWHGQIPLIILFDKNGQALTYFLGVVTEEDIINAIKNFTGVNINNENNISTNGSLSN